MALNAANIPLDPHSDIPLSSSHIHNPATENLLDMKVALPTGVENQPFYYVLETLTLEERQNARIEIEFMMPVSKNVEMFAQEIEQLWNSGYFDEALALFAELNEIDGVKGNTLIGISWRTPIPAPVSDWADDVLISARDSIFVLAMDHNNGNDNLYAIIGFTGDGMGSKQAMNFSDDGGATWAETFVLYGFTYVMNDIDGCFVGDHFYVAYTGGIASAPNSMAWLRCFKAADGEQDTFPNGNGSFNIFNTTEITDVEISSNHDQYNNRLYFSCIEAGGITHFFWNDPYTVTWTGQAMNITDALQGYDMNWNLYFTTYALVISYITDANQVQIYGWDGTTFTNLMTYGINSTYYYYTTSCGGHDDTLFCAFNYHNTYHLVRYLIQYGSGSWLYGHVGSTSENNYAPDATLRGAGGIHCVYRGPTPAMDGYYRWRPYSGGWSSHIQYNNNDVTGNIRPEIEYVGSGAYGTLYRTPMGSPYYGICYFDRSDWEPGIEEASQDVTARFITLAPNPSNGIAKLSYIVKTEGNVKISMFDAAGRLVNALVNETKPAGEYTVNMNNQNLAAGIYFIRVKTPEGVNTKPMTIIR